MIPAVESQYPILDDCRYRAVAGGSLGGIAAYRIAFRHPEKFGSAGISSEEERIAGWLSSMTEASRVRVFMDTGDGGVLRLDRAKVMKSMLDQAGVENQLHVGQGGHN